MNVNVFKTLLLREWFQHQRGWLVLVAAPLVIALVVGLVASPANVHFDGGDLPPREIAAPVIAAALMAGLALLTLLLAWSAALIQSPGLARRDVQDRSIEFWLSLPVDHASAVAAPLLAHLLLLPLAALAVGWVGGIVATLPVVAKFFGLGAWLGLPWGSLLAATGLIALRFALGVLLASLWLAPLVLVTMAASAWFKRWGVPLIAGVVGLGGLFLKQLYGIGLLHDAVQGAFHQVLIAMVGSGGDGPTLRLGDGGDGDASAQFGMGLEHIPVWAADSAREALAALATPGFAAALAVAAIGFALLVLRRSRHG